MKILVIGSGGREHALGYHLAQSEHQPTLYFAPGNPGMASLGTCVPLQVTQIDELVTFAQQEQIDLTVVGPEVPLSLGIVDRFQALDLLIFGPTKVGARMEASKAYAKEIMVQAEVPTAGYKHCKTQDDALEALKHFSAPYVIKEDGLAAGKGVTICQTLTEAQKAVEQAFNNSMEVVIEEFLQGEELSVIAICDGNRALPLVGAQDYKKVGEGNVGPNTGGMGAYAPVSFATPELLHRVQNDILSPVMRALKERHIDYRGVLYAGLMVSPEGEAKVIEFNARFGDPETQVILPLIDTDLVDLLTHAAQGDLSAYQAMGGIPCKAHQAAVTVVLASQGYPGDFQKGVPIQLPAVTVENSYLFHAGTTQDSAKGLVTSGGRVLNATAWAPTVEEARQAALALAEQVSFETKFYRKDIAAASLSPDQLMLASMPAGRLP